MSNIGEFANLDLRRLLIFLLLFASTIAPGILLVYFFKNSLITSLDIFKLILFAFSITIPVFVLNSFLLIPFIHDKDSLKMDDENRLSLNFIFGGLITLIQLNAGILIAYLFHFPIRYFVFYFCAVQLVIVFVCLVKSTKEST